MASQSHVMSNDTANLIVESGEVYTYFQPVIHLPGKNVFGFEALNKGELAEPGEPVRLSDLAFCGCDPEVRIKIDRLCREKALGEFKILHGKQNTLKLFLNVDASILQYDQSDFTYLLKQVEESGLPPSSIVIEVSLNTVIKHIPVEVDAFYREYGFQTCVTDVDISQPFLDCLLRYEPTYMKIDSTFMPGGPEDYYRTKMLFGLLDHARKAGTSVVGLNVDSLAESVRLLCSGIVFQQGSFFAMVKAEGSTGSTKEFFGRIESAYTQYKIDREEIRAKIKRGYDARMQLISSVSARLSAATPDLYESILETQIDESDNVFVGYVLNDSGVQMVSSVFNGELIQSAVSMEGVFEQGDDHSMEDLYLYLDSGVERYVSQSYYSRLAGRECFTVARSFYSRIGLRYILVLEMLFPG